MRRRRIAVYYPWLYLTSGAERTILELARRSRHEITIFTSRYEPDATFPGLREQDVRVVDSVSVLRNPVAVALSGLRILLRKLDLSGFDALLVVCEGLGDLVVLRNRRIPAYNLCLTPLRIVFDPVYRANWFAEHGLLERAIVRAGSLCYRRIDQFVWRRYRRIFPISREVQQRIEAGGLADSARMRVLHPGVDLDQHVPSRENDYTFFVPGRIMWTKNLELAIDAFRSFRAQAPEPERWRLRIAGIVDRKSEPYLAALRARAGDDPAIEFRIRPSDEEMLGFYRSCFATLFTAFNEDWGLVVIEAMATGKPCIAVDSGGPREIVRDREDGMLAAPTPDSFARAMLELATQPALRERIATQAPDSAARFGWGPFIEAIDREIDDTLPTQAASAESSAEAAA